MSQDDGWIIRVNDSGKYVLQHYFASAEELPHIDSAPLTQRRDSLEGAVRLFHGLEDQAYPSEYGLTIDLSNEKGKEVTIETVKASRKPFNVDAVRVTAENMEAVAEWCSGEIREETEGAFKGQKYIHVRVYRPASDKQSKAFVGDWVLYAGTGYKVYTDRAFKNSFDIDSTEELPQPPVENVFDKDQSAEVNS